MLTPTFTILFAANPHASGAFYSKLFGFSPVEASPTFVLFLLDHGHRFALWSAATVEPKTTGRSGAGEIAITVADHAAVDATFEDWKCFGPTVLMPPKTLEFGRSFVVADPDGHRIRVLSLADEG